MLISFLFFVYERQTRRFQASSALCHICEYCVVQCSEYSMLLQGAVYTVHVNYTKNDTHGYQSVAFIVSLDVIWCFHLPLVVFCHLPSANVVK